MVIMGCEAATNLRVPHPYYLTGSLYLVPRRGRRGFRLCWVGWYYSPPPLPCLGSSETLLRLWDFPLYEKGIIGHLWGIIA